MCVSLSLSRNILVHKRLASWRSDLELHQVEFKNQTDSHGYFFHRYRLLHFITLVLIVQLVIVPPFPCIFVTGKTSSKSISFPLVRWVKSKGLLPKMYTEPDESIKFQFFPESPRAS